jgi:hypothetical protein
MVRPTVAETYQDVVESVKAFNGGLEEEGGLKNQLSFFRAWYYIPELDAVGPSKFIGYKGMTAKEYMTRYNQDLDGRETEPILGRWFEVLGRESVEDRLVTTRIEQLLQRYHKRPSRAFRCAAPPNWRLGKGDSSVAHNVSRPSRQGEELRPMVEVFWRAFLSLYPDDQNALAERILHRKP